MGTYTRLDNEIHPLNIAKHKHCITSTLVTYLLCSGMLQQKVWSLLSATVTVCSNPRVSAAGTPGHQTAGLGQCSAQQEGFHTAVLHHAAAHPR